MARPKKIISEGTSGDIITTPLGEVNDSLLEPLQEEIAESEPIEVKSVETLPKIKGKYATEYFKRNGIPYCEVCGAQYQTDSANNPVCPEKLTTCPRVNVNV